jgi:F0F1-type ATP synthase assembly protein I
MTKKKKKDIKLGGIKSLVTGFVFAGLVIVVTILLDGVVNSSNWNIIISLALVGLVWTLVKRKGKNDK